MAISMQEKKWFTYLHPTCNTAEIYYIVNI